MVVLVTGFPVCPTQEEVSTMDQPPLVPNVSEVRYAKEQEKQRRARDEERKKQLAAEMRRKAAQTQQIKK